MLVVIYRWTVVSGLEEQFMESWTELTQELKEKFGTLGSRLHRSEDGSWVAYAQWPDRETWDRAAQNQPAENAYRDRMNEATTSIERIGPMEVVSDLLTPLS